MLVNNDLTAFIFETGTLKLQAISSSIGAGTADMEIDLTLEGDEKIRIGFNPSFFKGALEAMTSNRCRFFFEGPRKAGVLKELLTDDAGVEVVSDHFVYAVMPALLPEAPT